MQTVSSRPQVGEAARAFTLPDVYGQRWSLQQFRGKRVLIFMWASW